MTRGTRRRGWLMIPALVFCLVAAAREIPLVDAVKHGDAATVRRLLQRRADVNAAEPDGTTALHWAAHRNDSRIADLLIRAGADVQAANRYGVTPLLVACAAGNAAVIETLLEAGADPNSAVPEGETALMTVARTGNVDALKVLVAHGAGVNAQERWRGQSALMWAAAENHPAAVRMLVEAGAEVEARSHGGFTPLLFAAREGRIEAARALLAAGAHVDDTIQPPARPGTPGAGPAAGGRTGGPAGTSALVLAIINAHYDFAAFLLDQGAEANADAQGWTALHQLVWTRKPSAGKGPPPPVATGDLTSLELAKALLAHGAHVNARQKKEPDDKLRTALKRAGATPFLLAAQHADVPLMRLLLEHGADPALTTNGHTTPLMAAAGVGFFSPGETAGTNEEAFEAVKLAYERGNDVNAVDDDSETAMHGAAHRNAPAIARFLAEKGAKLDVENSDGWTPLTIADGVNYTGNGKRSPEAAVALRELLKARGLLTAEQAVPNNNFAESKKKARSR